MKKITRGATVAVIFLLYSMLSTNVYCANNSVLFWNKLGSAEEVANSEIGPGIQLTSYKIADWEEAQFLPAQFGDGLFINHDINEGWANDGGNFFAINLNEVTVTPERGTLEFWFTFKYDSSTHNHTYFFIGRNALTDHFPTGDYPIDFTTNVILQAGWNGWDYGNHGKRFYFSIGYAERSEVGISTANYSAAPGGHLEFSNGSKVHFAFVWDVNGIDETGDTVRIYIDGNIEASSKNVWPTAGGFDPYLYLGAAPNQGSWDHYYNAVKGITDNLIIWDYAKTDFSDRFNENPLTSVIKTYQDVTSLADLNDNGFPEIAVLNTYNDHVYATLKDSNDKTQVDKIKFFNDEWTPTAISPLADMNGNGTDELAVLAVKKENGKVWVKVMDSETKEVLNWVYFLDNDWIAKGLTKVADLNNNGVDELAVLVVKKSTNKASTMIRDAETREQLKWICY